MLIGGNYLGSVKEVLGRVGKRVVLDVGCGSCSFVLDIAKEFPDAQVIGCDVAPMQRALAPPNLRIDIVRAVLTKSSWRLTKLFSMTQTRVWHDAMVR